MKPASLLTLIALCYCIFIHTLHTNTHTYVHTYIQRLNIEKLMNDRVIKGAFPLHDYDQLKSLQMYVCIYSGCMYDNLICIFILHTMHCTNQYIHFFLTTTDDGWTCCLLRGNRLGLFPYNSDDELDTISSHLPTWPDSPSKASRTTSVRMTWCMYVYAFTYVCICMCASDHT